MKRSLLISLLLASSLGAGELPELNDQPWIGWFAGYEGKDNHFGVGGDGRGALIPLTKDGDHYNSALWFRIQPVVLEKQPDGREFSRKVIEDGWEALSNSGSDEEKMAYRATAEGGVVYEVNFEIDDDTVMAGGRIIEKGDGDKPVRLVMRVLVPDYFRYERDKDDYEKKYKRDRVELVTANRKKQKFDLFEEIDAADINGSPIQSANVDFKFRELELQADAGDAGSFRFWNGRKKPLSMGFTLEWSADPGKKADGSERFTLRLK
ncbi:MAG: hypothetical protein AAGI48_01825 [Verrucomicrobiota bacterium]